MKPVAGDEVFGGGQRERLLELQQALQGVPQRCPGPGVALRAEGGRQRARYREALLAPWVLRELKTALPGGLAGV